MVNKLKKGASSRELVAEGGEVILQDTFSFVPYQKEDSSSPRILPLRLGDDGSLRNIRGVSLTLLPSEVMCLRGEARGCLFRKHLGEGQ